MSPHEYRWTFEFESREYVRAVRATGSNLRWRAMKQVVETKEFFLFYVTAAIAYYLPKRIVAAQDLAGVRDLVHAHVARNRVKLAA